MPANVVSGGQRVRGRVVSGTRAADIKRTVRGLLHAFRNAISNIIFYVVRRTIANSHFHRQRLDCGSYWVVGSTNYWPANRLRGKLNSAGNNLELCHGIKARDISCRVPLGFSVRH